MCGMGSVFSDVCVLTNTLKKTLRGFNISRIKPLFRDVRLSQAFNFLGLLDLQSLHGNLNDLDDQTFMN